MPAAKETYTFDQFVATVSPEDLPFVMDLHNALEAQGYKTKIESAKSGYVVSYIHPKTKKTLFNYVFRKSGMLVRIYADNLAQYAAFLDTMPDSLAAAIGKAPHCKRLLNPADCNARCPMGYVFSLRGTAHQKCRYGAFLLPVTAESAAFLQALIEKEAAARG